MQNIPVHLLNAFVEFNDSKNITEASVKLRITQSALTKQLKQLEEFLPNRVFTFSGRKKTLTPFGQDLHRRLKDRLGNIQELVRETWTLHSDAEQAKVKIAARRGILDRVSGQLKFKGAIYFQELSNYEIFESLRSLKAEIGIVHHAPDTHELIAKPLFKEEFHLVIPKSLVSNRPFFGEQLFSQLKARPCLGYRPDDEILKSVCTFNGVDANSLKIVRATENYQSLSGMVDAKQGWAVLPSYIAVSESRNWIVSIPAKVFPARQFFVVYRPEFASVAWFKELILEIRSCFESMN